MLRGIVNHCNSFNDYGRPISAGPLDALFEEGVFALGESYFESFCFGVCRGATHFLFLNLRNISSVSLAFLKNLCYNVYTPFEKAEASSAFPLVVTLWLCLLVK